MLRAICNTMNRLVLAAPVALSMFLIAGCENDREILDVETPDGGVEIEQDRDDGDIEIETHD